MTRTRRAIAIAVAVGLGSAALAAAMFHVGRARTPVAIAFPPPREAAPAARRRTPSCSPPLMDARFDSAMRS